MSAIPAGYKQTEAGVIPEDWTVKPFGKLFAFSNGVNEDKHAYGRGLRFINVLEPITYAHLHGSEIPGRVTVSDAVAATFSVKKGDVVFNRTSETDAELGLAATYLGSEQVVFGGFVIRGRPTDDSLDPVYSGYALRAPVIRSQIIPMGQGAVRANIGQQSLKLVLAPIPPLSEQRAIAEALSDADALIESLRQLLTKKRHLKQATMQELLTGKKRLPGFSGEWKSKQLGEICTMKSGAAITSANIDDYSEFPCYGGNGLRGYTTTYTHDGHYALIGRQGALCGNVVIVSGRFFASEHAVVVTPMRETDIQWLAVVLARMNLNQYSESSAQPGLSVSKLLVMPCTMPPLPEQSAIAAILADMDAEIADLDVKLAKNRALKQGMMQKLLTGEIRLL